MAGAAQEEDAVLQALLHVQEDEHLMMRGTQGGGD